MASQSVTPVDIMFQFLINSSNKDFREAANRALAKARHPALAEVHSHYVDNRPSFDQQEGRRIVEGDTKTYLRKATMALNETSKDASSDEQVVTLMKEEVKRMESEKQEAKQVEDSLEQNEIDLSRQYEKYLDLATKYMKDYKIPYKTKLDQMETKCLLTEQNIEHIEQRLEKSMKKLEICPNKEAFEQRKSSIKEIKDKTAEKEKEIEAAEERLNEFRKLPQDLLEEYDEVWKLLEERKWILSQLKN